MSEQFYVLMEQGWEYNDEYYSRGPGGDPKNVFTNKKKAEEAAQQKDLERFKELVLSGRIQDYTYDGLDGLLSDKVTDEDLIYGEGIFMTLFGVTAGDWYGSLWEYDVKFVVEPTQEQWEKLHSCFNLRFYDVVTVQKG